MLPATSRVALVTGSGKPGWLARRRRTGGTRFRVGHSLSQLRGRLAESLALFQSQGVETIAVQADLADKAAVVRMTQEILARFGRLDVLVSCAAVWNAKPLEDVTAADVREQWQANTLGAPCASTPG